MRLPLHLDRLQQGAALVPVFAEYVIPADDWSPQAANAMASRIADELIAQGCDERAANVAASAFLTFGFSPRFGLGDLSDVTVRVAAERALWAWAQAKVDAFNAAQAKAAA